MTWIQRIIVTGLLLCLLGAAGKVKFEQTVSGQLKLVGQMELSGGYKGLDIVDDVLVTVTSLNPRGLRVYEITDPKSPRLMGKADFTPRGLRIVGNEVFAASGWSGLRVFDIFNLSQPELVKTVNTQGGASDVVISGQYAYVVSGDAGQPNKPPKNLRIFDISDPGNPELLGVHVTDGSAFGVTVDGSIAYMANGFEGVELVDVSQPKNPRLVGEFKTKHRAYDVRVRSGVAYVADWKDGGVSAWDVSDASNPVKMGSIEDIGYAVELEIVGDYAYVACESEGIYILDIKNPKNPEQVYHTRDGTVFTIEVQGNHLYAAGRGGAEEKEGLFIYEIIHEATKSPQITRQLLDLKKGWNLVSFYVESEDMTPAAVLESVKGNLVQIKDLKNSYNPALPAFINTLKGLNVEDGYWVKVDADVSFELEGVVPAGGSIPVRPGWNLVGYPRENGAAPADELTSLEDTVLQFKNLKDSYNPALPAFINTLKVITPGLGYWLKVSEDGVWNVGDVSGDGGNRDIVNPGWGLVVVYPNVSATVLAQVTVEGKVVTDGSVVGAFVGDELRGLQEVVLANGKSYATLNVNLSEAEKVSFRIWHAENEREYGVTKTMTLEMGEMYGTATEFVRLDGVASGSGSTIRIVGYELEPFGFGFESQSDRRYVVEATGDLKEWGVVKTYNGTGTLIRFEDERDQVFPQIYYRVRVVE